MKPLYKKLLLILIIVLGASSLTYAAIKVYPFTTSIRNVFLEVCSERELLFPVVVKSYSQLSVSRESIESGSICDQVIGMESVDASRTDCSVSWVDEERSVAFLVATRTNTCRELGENEPLKKYFFSILFEDTVFPVHDLAYYFTNPEIDAKFPALDREDIENIARNANQYRIESLDYLIGQYVYFWGKKDGAACEDMKLDGDVLEHCRFTAINDLYPDYDAYAPDMKTLLGEYKNCDAVSEKMGHDVGEYREYYSGDINTILSACAMTYAQENNDARYCIDHFFGEKEEGFAGRYECIERSGNNVSEEYCNSLPSNKDGGSRMTPACFQSLAWVTLNEGYCDKLEYPGRGSSEYHIAECKEEVARLLSGERPKLELN
ncbi:MAG: hypothetical protein WCT28_04660 [Patescibacteria group bacterium]|jgi:hypothetical protein